jgi:hypothetical protein
VLFVICHSVCGKHVSYLPADDGAAVPPPVISQRCSPQLASRQGDHPDRDGGLRHGQPVVDTIVPPFGAMATWTTPQMFLIKNNAPSFDAHTPLSNRSRKSPPPADNSGT